LPTNLATSQQPSSRNVIDVNFGKLKNGVLVSRNVFGANNSSLGLSRLVHCQQRTLHQRHQRKPSK
jgi:hypothetical protein